MNEYARAQDRNLLLSAMNADDRALLSPHLQRVSLGVGDQVAGSGTAIDHIFFPEGGICALLIPVRTVGPLAVGVIGREGMIGVSALLGATEWRHDVVARAVDATALRIETDRLLGACRKSSRLQSMLLRFAGSLIVQISRATVTNLIEALERRMARWILLYHDRLDGDDMVMTHKEIGIMLGVRRASATDVLHVLEGRGAIRNTRGHIFVRDRALLEQIAAESYGDAEADYCRMIGPFGKSAMVMPAASPAS